VSVLLKDHLSTEEDAKTAALIRDLQQARVRGVPHTEELEKGVPLEISPRYPPDKAQQFCTRANSNAASTRNAERAAPSRSVENPRWSVCFNGVSDFDVTGSQPLWRN
jgi:hypothetical protein